jgi:hypothetical protein
MPAVASCGIMNIIKALSHFITASSAILLDAFRFASVGVRSNSAIRAENLFLLRQLALFVEGKVKARRANDRIIASLLCVKGCNHYILA